MSLGWKSRRRQRSLGDQARTVLQALGRETAQGNVKSGRGADTKAGLSAGGDGAASEDRWAPKHSRHMSEARSPLSWCLAALLPGSSADGTGTTDKVQASNEAHAAHGEGSDGVNQNGCRLAVETPTVRTRTAA
eukprot:2124410-Pleurochrysis_carterae.AAC.4